MKQRNINNRTEGRRDQIKLCVNRIGIELKQTFPKYLYGLHIVKAVSVI